MAEGPEARLKQLEKETVVEVKSTLPIKFYYRSGVQICRQAKVYITEGKHDRAYFLCLRYVTLFLEGIRTHPQFNTVPKEDKLTVKQNLKFMMEQAERLKPIVLRECRENHEEWLKKKAEQEKKLEDQIATSQHPSGPSPILLPSAPPDYDFSTSLNGGLRSILIPSTLISKFLKLAEKNTQNNIETCGLLTGTLQRDKLTITVLLLPEQTGSSDDCTAENDLATFNVIDQKGLLTLGWIHTHPSQEAFLSSVDLHSQFGYQAMMPEAVAIVCAPRHSNEVFSLTDMGLEIVGRCTARGFHPHAGPPLFEVARHAHFVDIPCEIVDLRKPHIR